MTLDKYVVQLVADLQQISVVGLVWRPRLRLRAVSALEALAAENRMLRLERDSLLTALEQVLTRPGHVGQA